jgi:hypothetical protein
MNRTRPTKKVKAWLKSGLKSTGYAFLLLPKFPDDFPTKETAPSHKARLSKGTFPEQIHALVAVERLERIQIPRSVVVFGRVEQ